MLLLLWCAGLCAQEVSNADCREKDKKVYITYNLDKEANISLKVSIDGGSFQSVNGAYLSGDVGVNVKAGTNKTIVWDVIRDRGKLIGEVKFQVVAVESTNAANKRLKEERKQNDPSSYANKRNRFYSEAGKFAFTLVEAGLAASLKKESGVPFILSVATFRCKMFEIAPAAFTYDLRYLSSSPRNGLYWKPQARIVFPLADNWALVPSVGPSYDIFNKEWWVVATARVRYISTLMYFDFYTGYEDKGFAVGVTVSGALTFGK